MTTKTLFLELNEINFEEIRAYIAQGVLPNFQRVLSNHDLIETTSEDEYEKIEPWIQWVTAHTGMSLEEHGIFRLGDIVNTDLSQIWEELEQEGLNVGAVSPMNAKNRTRNAAFFIPDPWTRTKVSGSGITRRLYDSVAQAVNDNATSRVSFRSLINLLIGLIRYARPQNYGKYLGFAASSKRKPWLRAMFLDLLLADVFVSLCRSTKPDFATLFLNAGAHIQHHYMFSSSVYSGPRANPDWYIDSESDPVLDVYKLYDHVLGSVMSDFPEFRVLIATGLHQDPHPELTFYWRLKDHADFLSRHGVPFKAVEPRMSRDFFIKCDSEPSALEAEQTLSEFADMDGLPLFSVDNRGQDLFVMLTYPREIGDDFVYRTRQGEFGNLIDDVAFVAIKNGQHNSIGYFIDTGANSGDYTASIPLTRLPEIVRQVVGQAQPSNLQA